MKYSVCLDSIYFNLEYMGADMPHFLEGMKLTKESGFAGVEFWDWRKKDINAIAAAKKELKLDIAMFGLGWVGACNPAERSKFLDSLRETVDVARLLGCKTILTMGGHELDGVPREVQHKNIVECLKAAAKIAEPAGLTMVLEPLNILVTQPGRGHPGTYLSTSKEGFEIVDEVGSPNIKLLFDMYHLQIMEGNLIANITSHIDQIGHLHAAANPGRGEITEGEINYRKVFKVIASTGYSGYCGLEYMPQKDVATGLKEAAQLIAEAI